MRTLDPEVDRQQISAFIRMMFRHADQGTHISLRAFLDDRDGTWHYHNWPSIAVNGSLDGIVDMAFNFASECAAAREAVVFAPPIASFSDPQRADDASLANGLCVSVELDAKPAAARQAIEAVLGPATAVIASGGLWSDPETGEIEDKLHVHWRLSKPTRTKIDHDLLRDCRKYAARLVGGDPTSITAVHPMRWPGSIHRKDKPRLCHIVEHHPEIEITLADAFNKLQRAAERAPVPGRDPEPLPGPPGEAEETAALVSAILTAADYHDPIAKLAMRFLLAGMPDGQVVTTLRGMMLAVPAGIRDYKGGLLVKDRWQSRYDDIWRAVTTARAKIPPEPKAPEPAPAPEPEPAPHLELGDDAFLGLAGEIVSVIKPETESDPAAILLQFLVSFGNAVGPGPYIRIEATRHHANLFAVLVGNSSSDRKGTSWRRVRQLFTPGDWEGNCIASGLSTGEGLIYHVRDPRHELQTDKKTGDETRVLVDEGVTDKRLLIVEEEIARMLRVMRRPENTLSAVARLAWDGSELRTLTRKEPLRANGAHISLIVHGTQDDIIAELDETSIANGFANRFLFFNVRRSQFLPFGGDLRDDVVAELHQKITDTIRYAQAPARFFLDPAAKEMWPEEYRRLNEQRLGLFGSITRRSASHVLRTALIYALLDQQGAIGIHHLKAALAVWDYADRSALAIFGDRTGDRIADSIFAALKQAGTQGMTRTEINELFGRNIASSKINEALQKLLRLSRAKSRRVDTKGRKTEVWSV